jgi:ribosomal protein L11 methyltransferase
MSRSWQLLRVTVPARRAELLQDTLAELGTLGVEERPAGGEPWRVHQPWEQPAAPHRPERVELLAYFEPGDDEQERVRRIQREIEDLPDAEIAVGRVSEGDWEERWRSAFQPLEVAPGVVIAPPWDPVPGSLLIEPGPAFGTGQHPTTLACLKAVARYATPGERLLDVGCGSGVLALLGARLGMEAFGVDCDPEAVRASLDNARRNQLTCGFEARPVGELSGHWDLVIANIFAEELVRMAADLRRLTGRRLVLAGILADRAALVERAMLPLVLDRREQDGEWVCLEYLRA